MFLRFKILSFKYNALLLLVFLFGIGMPLWGQMDKKMDKSLLVSLLAEDMDEESIRFLDDHKLLENIELATIFPFEEWRALIIKDKRNESRLGNLPTEIIWQSLFINHSQNDSLALALPTNYTNILFRSGLKIGEVPIKLQGRLVSSDFKFQTKLSNISINFDPRQYLNQFKKRYQPAPTAILKKNDHSSLRAIQDLGGKNLPSFTESDLTMIRKEVKFQLYQQIITHPDFIAIVDNRKMVQDSLDNRQDQLKAQFKSKQQEVTSTKDKALQNVNTMPQKYNRELQAVGVKHTDSLKALVNFRKAQADSLLVRYNETWEDRKAYYGDSLQMLKAKMNQYATKINQLNNPKEIRNKLLADRDISIGTRILAATEKIGIGQSILDDSWYTAKNLPINGVQYGFNTNRVYGKVAFGKQVFNTSFSPVLSTGLFNQLDGGKVLLLKGGYDFSEEGGIEYTFINLKDKGNFNQGTILAPKNNSVFSLSGFHRIKGNAYLNASVSFSRSIWGRTDLSFSNKLNKNNTAGEVTFSNSLFADDLTMEIGYFYVGSNFIAAGNPFLQNNQHGLVTKLTGKIGKKLELATELKTGKSIDAALLGGDQQRIQLLGSIQWYPINGWQISGQIAPNTFKHFGAGQISIDGSNLLYHAQISTQQPIKTSTIMLTGGYTNYNTQFQYYDTTLVNKTNYLFLQENLILPNQSNISMMVMMGFVSEGAETSGNQQSFFSEIDYQFTWNKWNTSAGIQLVKDAFLTDWFYGFTTTNNISLSPKMSINFDVSWQIPFQKEKEQVGRYWGRLELIKQF